MKVFIEQPFYDYDTADVHTPLDVETLDEHVEALVPTEHVSEDITEEHGDDNVVDMPGSVPRVSSKMSHPPVWMKDYVTHVTDSGNPHSLANYMSYSHLSGSYQTYLSTMSAEVEPKTYEEAIQDQRWVEAMKQEIAALEDNGTWKVVTLPSGKHAIGCKCVFKIKYKATGEIDRFKARLVVKRYSQIEGVYYHKHFHQL